MSLQESVRQKLYQLGFSIVRFTALPLSSDSLHHFKKWIEKNYHGEMNYLERRYEERVHPELLLDTIQSAILVAYPYDTGLENTFKKSEGNISRYAWGKDYHDILKEKLKKFQTWLYSQSKEAKCYLSVDSSPVLEKVWAQKAGIGWIGKHTNIIHQKHGSYFFLGSVFTNLSFLTDQESQDYCGSCQRCIDVCPTQAIIAPYVLDARRCISYLTIELKGPIPRDLRPFIKNHVFGCDDCQEVCPWNRFSQKTHEENFFPQDYTYNQSLKKLIQIKKNEFKTIFATSPILRTKWRGLMRNVLIAIGNSGDQSLIPYVEEKLHCEEALVRGHAVWSYASLLGKKAFERLKMLEENETDPFVLEELRVFFDS
ncbi:MAG: tRNA epoxyqueuosine(34) reductase QueG [Deltaproteobacteria bacterium]|nr:tRNA epoxyqueuosine(34) reductase QueG [Deltaproteobacteria bacterium]